VQGFCSKFKRLLFPSHFKVPASAKAPALLGRFIYAPSLCAATWLSLNAKLIYY
jgi:hypothetical protein